jgi:hypothetical protein
MIGREIAMMTTNPQTIMQQHFYTRHDITLSAQNLSGRCVVISCFNKVFLRLHDMVLRVIEVIFYVVEVFALLLDKQSQILEKLKDRVHALCIGYARHTKIGTLSSLIISSCFSCISLNMFVIFT